MTGKEKPSSDPKAASHAGGQSSSGHTSGGQPSGGQSSGKQEETGRPGSPRREEESPAVKGGKHSHMNDPHEPPKGASDKIDPNDPTGAARKGGRHSHTGEPRK